MKQKELIQKLIEKTYAELSQTKKPIQKSRVWSTSEGYKFLVQWSNLILLRIMVKKVIDDLKSSNYPLSSFSTPLNKSLIARLESQLLDAIRSSIANIEEGWKRSTTSEYLQFIGYSQGSLEEVKGDIKRMVQDSQINSSEKSSLSDLGIDLKLWNEWAKDPLHSAKILHFPLKGNKGGYRKLEEVKGKAITYEMFIELINKTDFLIRKLVESLEKKLNSDQKGYQIDRAKIKDWSKGGR